MAKPASIAAPRKPLLSRLAILLALAAFLVQGIAVQIHIHGRPVPVGLTNVAVPAHLSAPAGPASQDPYDPANCPLCQEALHAGTYLVPATATFFVLLNAVALAPLFVSLPHPGIEQQQGWQSRAPPRR
jgi:hypothetical protein